MKATIWHNPRCSKSRGALEILREAGIEPEVVDYLGAPPPRAQWEALVAALGLPVRALLRGKEAAELGLDLEGAPDGQLFEALLANPRLLERPVVVTAKGARICRPPEVVRALL